jgi:hypothetical protein
MGKKDKKEHLSDEEDLSSDEVGDDQGQARVNAKKSKKGIKWSAVFMLGLFVVPAFFGACVYLYDMFYPEVMPSTDHWFTYLLQYISLVLTLALPQYNYLLKF